MSLGETLDIGALRAEFDRVFVATGAWALPRIGLEGEDDLGAGLAFLSAVARGERRVPGPRVLVIGGGSVAMDVAVTARRLGAAQVTVACLETCEEMPALLEEVEEALAEGIELVPSCGPARVLRSGDALVGMELVRCSSVFDENACFAPSFDESSRETVMADEVILAVGQRVEAAALEAAGLSVQGGRLAADPATQRTAVDGVYAGGDVATGPATVIAAMGAGRRAAESIHAELAPSETGDPATAGARPGGAGEPALQTFDPTCALHSARCEAAPAAPADRTLCEEDCCTLAATSVPREAARCFNCGCVAVTPSDLAPVLVALDATVVTTSRELPAAEFFAPRRASSTVLDAAELVVEVVLPPPPAGARAAYEKFRLRNAIDFPILSVAAAFVVRDGSVAEARVVLGAAAPVPLRVRPVELALEGLQADPPVLAAAAREAAAAWAAGCAPLAPNAYKVQIATALIQAGGVRRRRPPATEVSHGRRSTGARRVSSGREAQAGATYGANPCSAKCGSSPRYSRMSRRLITVKLTQSTRLRWRRAASRSKVRPASWSGSVTHVTSIMGSSSSARVRTASMPRRRCARALVSSTT